MSWIWIASILIERETGDIGGVTFLLSIATQIDVIARTTLIPKK